MTAEKAWTNILRGLAALAAVGFVASAAAVFTPLRIASDIPQPIAIFSTLGLLGASVIASLWHQLRSRTVPIPITYLRASRLGLIALLCFGAQRCVVMGSGFSSTSYELAKVREHLEEVGEAQVRLLADSGRYATTIAELGIRPSDYATMKIDLVAAGYRLASEGYDLGATCEVTDEGAEPDRFPTSLIRCHRGPRVRKALIPDFPLFLIAGLLTAWVAAGRPARPKRGSPPAS